MKTPASWITLALFAALLPACRQEPTAKESVFNADTVAVVAGRPISRATLEQELARRGGDTTKEAVLAELIHAEATLAKLRAAGFDRDPEMVAAVERMLVARFEERELAAAEAPTVNEDEVRARYAADAARYAVPAMVRGGVLFLKASSKAEPQKRTAVAQQAEQLRARAEAADDAAFAQLVRENSEDQTSRYHAGDTGWLSAPLHGGWEPAVVEGLLALQKVGQCSPVIETTRGYYLVRLNETKPATTRPLTEVADAIRHQLQREKREQLTAAFRTKMVAGLEIRTNTVALTQVLLVNQTNVRPPSLP